MRGTRSSGAVSVERRIPGSTETGESRRETTRDRIAQAFTRVEDVVYVGLGVVLGIAAVTLLGHAALDFGRALIAGAFPARVVELLDRLLLILMIIEVLYTVQVSFREHALAPEPFLIVGLIAATRRILVLTAEFADLKERGGTPFATNAMTELALLTVMIIALVTAIVLLRRHGAPVLADRA
jgi:hypothetical protein